MQINTNELNAVLSAFHLPTIHSDIPRNPIIAAKTEVTLDELARSLVKSSVIDCEKLPETVSTTNDLLLHGLAQWFQSRTKGFSRVDIEAGIWDTNTAEVKFDMFETNEREYNAGPVLHFSGTGDYSHFELETSAKKLERVVPGLFLKAYRLVKQASYITTPIYFPEESANNISYQTWDCDLYDLADDDSTEHIHQALEDRFGDAPEEMLQYSPANILPMFGEGVLFSYLDKKKKLPELTDKKVREIANKNRKSYARDVAQQLLVLKKSLSIARKKKACLPDLEGCYGDQVNHGCYLFYVSNDITRHQIDNDINDAMNGSGTDVHGWIELPTSVSEIKQYFKQLDLALTVLRDMDALLKLISEPY